VCRIKEIDKMIEAVLASIRDSSARIGIIWLVARIFLWFESLEIFKLNLRLGHDQLEPQAWRRLLQVVERSQEVILNVLFRHQSCLLIKMPTEQVISLKNFGGEASLKGLVK
ncbi:hypothetical protein LTR40_013370, partial [Exophiala xenobiotica]